MSENPPSSREASNEIHALLERLRGKSIAEIIAMIGEPIKEYGPYKEERVFGAKPETVVFTRTLVFAGVGKTFGNMAVWERQDGGLEFRFQAKA